jgi:hypothetical protein
MIVRATLWLAVLGGFGATAYHSGINPAPQGDQFYGDIQVSTVQLEAPDSPTGCSDGGVDPCEDWEDHDEGCTVGGPRAGACSIECQPAGSCSVHCTNGFACCNVPSCICVCCSGIG